MKEFILAQVREQPIDFSIYSGDTLEQFKKNFYLMKGKIIGQKEDNAFSFYIYEWAVWCYAIPRQLLDNVKLEIKPFKIDVDLGKGKGVSIFREFKML